MGGDGRACRAHGAAGARREMRCRETVRRWNAKLSRRGRRARGHYSTERIIGVVVPGKGLRKHAIGIVANRCGKRSTYFGPMAARLLSRNIQHLLSVEIEARSPAGKLAKRNPEDAAGDEEMVA